MNEYLAAFLNSTPLEDDDSITDIPKPYRRLQYAIVLVTNWELRHKLVSKYSWSVPTDEAIATVAALSPILSIGAGTGYWEMLLRLAGADVMAFDNAINLSITDRSVTGYNSWHKGESHWSEVLPGGPEVVENYPERTLMLAWPPMDGMALECLRYYRGARLVYIGEWGGCTADEAFHDALERDWETVATVRLPQWYGIHDCLWILKRKQEQVNG